MCGVGSHGYWTLKVTTSSPELLIREKTQGVVVFFVQSGRMPQKNVTPKIGSGTGVAGVPLFVGKPVVWVPCGSFRLTEPRQMSYAEVLLLGIFWTIDLSRRHVSCS